MPHHQYACPECGLTRQSAEDLSGKEIQCAGCQATFVAASLNAANWGKPPVVVAKPAAVARPAPTPVVVAPAPPASLKVESPPAPAVPPPPVAVQTAPDPRPVPPRQLPPPVPRAKRTPPPEPEEYPDSEPEPDVYLPPIPTSRRFPVGLVLVGALVVIGLAAGGILIAKYRSGTTEPDAKPVVQAPPDKPAPAPSADPRPKTTPQDQTPFVAPPAPSSRPEEEEELPARPAPGTTGSKPDRKVGESILQDIDSILPKPSGSKTTDTKPTGATPAPSAAKPADKPTPNAPDSPAGDGQIPADLLAKLKAATVFIKIDGGEMHGSGSGFVVRVTDDTALVVTNEHVAQPKSKLGASVNAVHEVVFYSGRRNEFSRTAEVIAADPEHDLAVLRVSGVRDAKDFPEPINTTDRPALAETAPIYVIGFPFGNMLATGRENPGVTINRGTISAIRDDEAGDTALIQIDSDANPGNSGGPVVDGRGRLVGVLRGGKPGTKINIAIPGVELTRMMNGRVSNLKFRVGRIVGPTAEMEITGNLVDPLDKVKAPSIRVARADSTKEKPSVGSDGKWGELQGAETTDLRVNGHLVSGSVKLPLKDSDRGQIEILFQPACVNRDGRSNYFAPVTQTLVIHDGPGGDFPGGPVSPPGGFRRPGGPAGGLPMPPPLPPPPVGGGNRVPGGPSPPPPPSGPPPGPVGPGGPPPGPVGPGGGFMGAPPSLPTPPSPPPPPGSGRPGPPTGGKAPPSKGGPPSPRPGDRPPGG